MNNDNELLASFKSIYFKELELTVEHQGNYASFLDLDVEIEDCFHIKTPWQ